MITLRKTSLFLYFEMLINSSFIDTNARFIIKKSVNLVSNIPVLLILSYQNKFFHNIKNQFSKPMVEGSSPSSPDKITTSNNVNFYY